MARVTRIRTKRPAVVLAVFQAVALTSMLVSAPADAGPPPPTSKKFSYTAYITVSTTSVAVTLHRSNPNVALMVADHSGYTEGMIYGPGLTVTSVRSGAWELRITAGDAGQGFYEASGGLVPGTSTKVHTYMNPVYPNGVYTGSAVLRYYTAKWGWLNGPVIRYTITLAN